jgi:hypothetical protein
MRVIAKRVKLLVGVVVLSFILAPVAVGNHGQHGAPRGPEARVHWTAPTPDASDTDPPFSDEWHHTSLKVPDRPYMVELAESGGPTFDPETGSITSNCPGSFLRLLYVDEDEWTNQTGSAPVLMRGDLNPEIVGVTERPSNGWRTAPPTGFKEGTAPPIAWFSPHDAIVFPNLIITTYYGAGLRAIDIREPVLARRSRVLLEQTGRRCAVVFLWILPTGGYR